MYHLARAVEAEAEAERLRKDTEADSLAITDLEAEVERLRAVLEQISGSGTVDGADARAALSEVLFERDALRATLREIEQATEGIPEQNCMIANRLARVGQRDTAPAEEGWGYDTETGEEGEP
jgi:hypothetical protein